MRYYERERREFVRVDADIPVAYRFLSHDPAFPSSAAAEAFAGKTSNLSAGGLLLGGTVPDADWIPGLLTERIFLGVELRLPGEEEPVRALTRAAWVEAAKGETASYLIGLRFKEITRDDLDKICRFVIDREMG